MLKRFRKGTHKMNLEYPPNSMRILLVDDNKTTSQQLIQHMKNQDYDITATNNVKNAVNLIVSENKFDLILLNLVTLSSDAFNN